MKPKITFLAVFLSLLHIKCAAIIPKQRAVLDLRPSLKVPSQLNCEEGDQTELLYFPYEPVATFELRQSDSTIETQCSAKAYEQAYLKVANAQLKPEHLTLLWNQARWHLSQTTTLRWVLAHSQIIYDLIKRGHIESKCNKSKIDLESEWKSYADYANSTLQENGLEKRQNAEDRLRKSAFLALMCIGVVK